MAEAMEEPTNSLGKYKGYKIVEERAEFRGLEGGFNKGTSVQAVPTDLDVFFAGKARQKGERYDYVVKEKSKWRIISPEDTKPEGVVHVRIFTASMAAFADAGLIGDAIHKVSQDYAEAEAAKAGQGNFTVIDGGQ